VDVEAIEKVAEEVTGIPFARKRPVEKDKSFKEHFGCRSIVVAMAWQLMQQHTMHETPDAFELKHLLWALTFLKTYSVEGIRASLASSGTDKRPNEKIVRDWCWIALECLASIEPYVVSCVVYIVLLHFPDNPPLIPLLYCQRSSGIIVMKVTPNVIVWSLLMVPIF
jgi:hypothetical protein